MPKRYATLAPPEPPVGNGPPPPPPLGAPPEPPIPHLRIDGLLTRTHKLRGRSGGLRLRDFAPHGKHSPAGAAARAPVAREQAARQTARLAAQEAQAQRPAQPAQRGPAAEVAGEVTERAVKTAKLRREAAGRPEHVAPQPERPRPGHLMGESRNYAPTEPEPEPDRVGRFYGEHGAKPEKPLWEMAKEREKREERAAQRKPKRERKSKAKQEPATPEPPQRAEPTPRREQPPETRGTRLLGALTGALRFRERGQVEESERVLRGFRRTQQRERMEQGLERAEGVAGRLHGGRRKPSAEEEEAFHAARAELSPTQDPREANAQSERAIQARIDMAQVAMKDKTLSKDARLTYREQWQESRAELRRLRERLRKEKDAGK